MPDQRFPFASLPVELQQQVFLHAGTMYPKSAMKLVFVARRVNTWVQPLIYRMVTLGNRDAPLFMRTFNQKPPDFFATNVKYLCLTVGVNPENAVQIISICTGVRSLAFWVDYLGTFPDRSISSFISSLSLRRLSVEVKHYNTLLQASAAVSTWCRTLTHLDLIFWSHEDSPIVPGLDQMDSLTHLALWLGHTSPNPASISQVFAACRCLQIFVIVGDEEAEQDCITLAGRKVVTMAYPQPIVQNWEAPFYGQSDTWTLAEEITDRNKASTEDD